MKLTTLRYSPLKPSMQYSTLSNAAETICNHPQRPKTPPNDAPHHATQLYTPRGNRGTSGGPA